MAGRLKVKRSGESAGDIRKADGLNRTGYRLATDEETRQYAKQETARGAKILKKAAGMLKRCTVSDGIQIPVRAHMRTLRGRREIENQMSLEDIL